MARKIPPGHTLTVAVQCLERSKVNPALLEELRKIAEREAKKDPVRARVDENKRIERQRTLWAMVPDTTATERLKEAILNRAWELLEVCECEAADALLEFVPSKDADKLLSDYFRDE